jgi:hypothetical protein
VIAINSTGYPCLAVSQHFNVPYDKVLEAGSVLLTFHLTGRGADRLLFTDIPDDALDQLVQNYEAAARVHKWGKHGNVH